MKKTGFILMIGVVLLFFCFPFLENGYRDAIKTDLTDTFAPMSAAHYFGTDHLGRDLYSLIADGAVRTLSTIFIASSIALGVGVWIGTLGAYYGGLAETIVQFLTDILMIIPSFILALILAAMMGLSPLSAGITLGISGVGDYANQAMILTKNVKHRGFILSEQSMGIGSMHIVFRHIIPNIITPILTSLGNRASAIALQYASLSFIGLGADLTKSDWGALLYQYRIYIIDRPVLLFWPSLSIFSLALVLHLLFDAKEG